MAVCVLGTEMENERKGKSSTNTQSNENDLQRAAISLGRSAPNLPNRLLLASRSKGEWLLMELKGKGYTAGGKPVM